MKQVARYGLPLIVFALCLSACHDKGPIISPSGGKIFVLVHGAWQAPFVWDSIKPILEAAGDKVVAVELPGHGGDTTSPQNLTMDIYRDKVISAVENLPGKIILVGHSMGGVVITAVGEAIPDKIDKLIYVGAFLPADRQSLLDLAGSDTQSLLGPALIPLNSGVLLDIIRDSITNIFCEDGTKKQKDLVLRQFEPEPGIPFGNSITITAARFGSVEKYYIHTALDNAVGLDLQYRMALAAHVDHEYSLNTGHCPFITDATATAALFLHISNMK